jgi:hypothetical protein
MKHPLIKSMSVTLALVLLALAPGWFITGCKSPEQAALKITAGTVITVESGMKAFLDAQVAGLVTPEQETIVRDSYMKYYTAVQAERDAIIAYKQGTDTNSLALVSSAITAASGDLLQLIFQFLPPDRLAKLKKL